MKSELNIGTCSWKFPAWEGLVYTKAKDINYLEEYSARFDCVEVDQRYWSLFGIDKVALPRPETVKEYAESVPKNFRFGVKLPDALTLTHLRRKDKSETMQSNPHFLSTNLLNTFLETLEPIHGNLGPLMLQFGYLNREMVPAPKEFRKQLDSFLDKLPKGFLWAVELRNPNWLNERYFQYLKDRGIAHVWEQGHHMPSVAELYPRFADLLTDDCVIRMHGPDWKGMEKRQDKDWSKITEPRDKDVNAVAKILKDMIGRKKKVWAFVNNHFEGCAPKSVERIKKCMG